MTLSQSQAGQVFLLGAGRSGSTLLYKVLCLHPEIGYISNYDNSMPSWFSAGWIKRIIADNYNVKREVWFESDGNAYGIERSLLKRLVPWPVEGENVYRRSAIPLEGDFDAEPDMQALQCLRGYLEGLRRAQHTPLFLNKRVANNRRIPWLKAAFSDARYIHLIRDGRDVAYSFSKVSWWGESSHVWWAGKTMKEMVDSGEDFLSVTARTWVEATRKVTDELKVLPSAQVLDVRYEDLMASPLEQIKRMLEFMELTMTADVETAVASLQLRPRRARWRSEWDAGTLQTVLGQQQQLLEQLGYEI